LAKAGSDLATGYDCLSLCVRFASIYAPFVHFRDLGT